MKCRNSKHFKIGSKETANLHTWAMSTLLCLVIFDLASKPNRNNLLILWMMCTKLLNCRHIYSFGNVILGHFQRESPNRYAHKSITIFFYPQHQSEWTFSLVVSRKMNTHSRRAPTTWTVIFKLRCRHQGWREQSKCKQRLHVISVICIVFTC